MQVDDGCQRQVTAQGLYPSRPLANGARALFAQSVVDAFAVMTDQGRSGSYWLERAQQRQAAWPVLHTGRSCARTQQWCMDPQRAGSCEQSVRPRKRSVNWWYCNTLKLLRGVTYHSGQMSSCSQRPSAVVILADIAGAAAPAPPLAGEAASVTAAAAIRVDFRC